MIAPSCRIPFLFVLFKAETRCAYDRHQNQGQILQRCNHSSDFGLLQRRYDSWTTQVKALGENVSSLRSSWNMQLIWTARELLSCVFNIKKQSQEADIFLRTHILNRFQCIRLDDHHGPSCNWNDCPCFPSRLSRGWGEWGNLDSDILCLNPGPACREWIYKLFCFRTSDVFRIGKHFLPHTHAHNCPEIIFALDFL